MARRSWWGWGNVEDAVTGAEAAGLVARVASFLPSHDFTVHAPPEVADLDLPAPRVGVPDSLALIASHDVADRAVRSNSSLAPEFGSFTWEADGGVRDLDLATAPADVTQRRCGPRRHRAAERQYPPLSRALGKVPHRHSDAPATHPA